MNQKKSNIRITIFIVIFLILVCMIGYFFWKNQKLESRNTSTSTPIPSTEIFSPSPPQINVERSEKNVPSARPSPSIRMQTKPKDITSPKAYILTPEDKQHVRAPVKIVANVTDDVKVDRVEFYAGSSDYQHIGTITQVPYEVMWIPASGFSGYGNINNIPVYIKAFDSSGNRGDSFISIYLDQ